MIKCHSNSHGCILADEMGLGKTLQAISVCVWQQAIQKVKDKILVLCPLSTLDNWKREFERFGCDVPVIVYRKEKEERLKFQRKLRKDPSWVVLLTTYEICLADQEFLQRFKWGKLIVDEAHRLKNPNALLYQALEELQSSWTLFLTGTPIQNNLHELHALLHFCVPSVFSEVESLDFVNRYGNDLPGLKRMLETYLLRRTKDEVGLEIPEKSEVVLYHGISGLQKKLYKSILLRNRDAFTGADASRNRLMNTLVQLRKVISHPYIFHGVEPEPFQEGEHIVEASGKFLLLDALLKHLHSSGHRVLLFAQMTRTLDILQDYLTFRGFSYERLDGSVRGEERFAAMDRFSKEDTFCFMLSTHAGGIGLNLMQADTVIFMESDINPQWDIQAAARAHRIGQTKPVKIIRLLGRHTVEELIQSRSAVKVELANSVMDDGAAEKCSPVKWTELLMFGLQHLESEDNLATANDKIDFDTLLGKTKNSCWVSSDEQVVESSETQPTVPLPNSTVKNLYTFEGEDYTEASKLADKAALEAIFSEAVLLDAPRAAGDNNEASSAARRARKQTEVRLLQNASALYHLWLPLLRNSAHWRRKLQCWRRKVQFTQIITLRWRPMSKRCRTPLTVRPNTHVAATY